MPKRNCDFRKILAKFLNGGILQQAMFACQRVNQIPLFGGSYRPCNKTRVDKHDKTHVLATLGLYIYIYYIYTHRFVSVKNLTDPNKSLETNGHWPPQSPITSKMEHKEGKSSLPGTKNKGPAHVFPCRS